MSETKQDEEVLEKEPVLPGEADLDPQIEELKHQLEQAQDQYQRVLAEYANYKRRTEQEKEAIGQFAKSEILRQLLPSLDNLERAVASLTEDDPHRQGMEMILKQYKESLTKLGVTETECLGAAFDPEKMNAVMHVEDETVGENTVVEVFQKGFELGDKVLRFAMVKVAN